MLDSPYFEQRKQSEAIYSQFLKPFQKTSVESMEANGSAELEPLTRGSTHLPRRRNTILLGSAFKRLPCCILVLRLTVSRLPLVYLIKRLNIGTGRPRSEDLTQQIDPVSLLGMLRIVNDLVVLKLLTLPKMLLLRHLGRTRMGVQNPVKSFHLNSWLILYKPDFTDEMKKRLDFCLASHYDKTEATQWQYT